MPWYRGCTHLHSSRSDGNAEPEEALGWYRDQGYDFACLTDHCIACPADIADRVSDESFLAIPGQELSEMIQGLPIHVNALGVRETIVLSPFSSVSEGLVRMVEAVRERGAVATINHPNFFYGFTHREINSVPGILLLEVYNGHPEVNNMGSPARDPVEVMWDRLLATGRRIYAIATDDTHHFGLPGTEHPCRAVPGRGWVCVEAPSLTAKNILEGLASGKFYASTGVFLDSLRVEGNRFFVVEAREGTDLERILWIGRHGEILGECADRVASFDLEKVRDYVRAKVIGKNRCVAWSQPVYRSDL